MHHIVCVYGTVFTLMYTILYPRDSNTQSIERHSEYASELNCLCSPVMPGFVLVVTLCRSFLVIVFVTVSAVLQWNTRHGEVLAHSQFYVPAVNEVVDFVEDFFNWINPKEHVRYSPTSLHACTIAIYMYI